MTNLRALGHAGILGALAVLIGCAGSDSADERSAGDFNSNPATLPSIDATPTSPRVSGAGFSDGEAVGTDSSGVGPSGALTPGAGTSAEGGLPLTPSDDDSGAELPADPAQAPRPQQVPAGTLTAGAWDDNRNLDHFLDYRADLLDQGMRGMLGFSVEDHEAAQELAVPRAHTSLDISLVIDTTGSMGDELRYLQTEFLAISAQIEATYPAAEQRWSLVVYRDVGDEYTARQFDFTTDPVAFRGSLAAQAAGGGGDFPEAPEAAFQNMNQLDWRNDDATARLAFWVADAPHHDYNASALREAIQTAQDQGVHIYPVASSGVDELTELTMRSAAQLTGGRYLFLTDDSGVGGAHKEPSIPCYFVTKLDAAIQRMVDIEMSGAYHEPASAEILRAGGDPQNGACQLQSGSTVLVF
jgi:hypothetical protein